MLSNHIWQKRPLARHMEAILHRLRWGIGLFAPNVVPAGSIRQIGLESTPEEYLTKMVSVFREVWRGAAR